jgi:SRSO17 transposase
VSSSPEIDDLPDGAVTPEDLEEWDREFGEVLTMINPLFYRTESRMHAEHYLRGLLAPLERKNSWTIFRHTGEREPKALQRFLNLTPWDEGQLRDINLEYVIKHFRDPRGTLIADPTGFAKKGKKSAGVQRQYSGTLGRIDNCQIGTFLAYADTHGDRVLVDRELYIPEESWCNEPERRREAGIPDDLTFATRPQQARTMIERMIAAGLPFAWFTADEEFGQNPGLRKFLEDEKISYVMAIPKNTRLAERDGQAKTIEGIVPELREHDWQRRACGIGTKGFRVYDWAFTDAGEPDISYMIRRNTNTGELAYYRCHNPRHEPAGELVRVAGTRWPVEECFEAAKGEAGLDQYQVRLYRSWYRHITLAMLALTFLAVIRKASKKGTPDLWKTSRA